MSCSDIFLAFIAILFPPIAVWIKCGLCTADSFINIALCCLGYLPGLIHAWYIIARNPDPMNGYEPIRDPERSGDGSVTYYYISHEQQQRGYGSQQAPVRKPQGSGPARQAPNPPTEGGSSSVGAAGEEAAAPPSYSDVVKGDHKVQTHD